MAKPEWTPSAMGKKGNVARQRNLSAAERKALAKAAAEARWREHRKATKPKRNKT